MTILKKFVDLNRRLCRSLTPKHVHEANVFGVYRKLGGLLLSHPKVVRVVDCGAGKSWHFPSHYKRWYGVHLIGLDIDAEEMVGNDDVDEALTCDVTQTIPVQPGSIDLITVSSGIEHFSDNEAFLRNAFGLLRPNGYLLAQFPGRYAPFAIVNRLLPKRASRSLLRVSMSETADVLGFRAYYDRTDYASYKKMIDDVGFVVTYYSPGYYSSYYANFFFPLWLLSYAYDTLRFGLGIKALASYNLFVLQKPDVSGDPEPFRLYAWDDQK